ncbi:FecR domain-containing protein [Fulvivirgaceae bacterium BMA12]|uniref:FecR domain-containing protein n=1 Tax=Agaribacillus aureus TaxID=3051825 RepID=A0ABT8L1P1_9BACT|nr:FecR domain-containing protein [Fulvivirgaceae bacterium BMA12]
MKNIKYSDYSLEDFLQDDYFIDWVMNPSPESNYFWENWMAKHPGNSKIAYLAKEMIGGLEYKNSVLPTHNEKVEVLENIIKRSSSKNVGSKLNKVLKIAAVVAILIGFLYLFNSGTYRKTKDLAVAPPTIMLSKQTSYGEQKTVKLPDGTIVRLNYGSRLIFPSEFGDSSRQVTLSGEAFFDVKPNPDKPFIITTKDVQTIVLGTSFNINAYSDEDEIQVMVVTGKVRVQNGADADKLEDVMLLPYEMVSLHRLTGRVVKEKYDPSEYLAWKEWTLIFRKATFDEIIDKLEKWYGVDIQIDQDLHIQGRFNGEFHNQSLEYVLKGLSFSNRINFELKDKTVTISKNENI